MPSTDIHATRSPRLASDAGAPHLRTSTFSPRSSRPTRSSQSSSLVALLTGGGDKPYAIGLSAALAAESIYFDFIGSDELAVPEVLDNPFARFLNLRGSQDPNAPGLQKIARVLLYYLRLLLYAVRSDAPIFHILWHNKFEWFDRTILLLYYRALGKRIVLTAHNVNTQARDGKDSFLNRLTLAIQYKLLDHAFVHTGRMKDEIVARYKVSADKISVIPFGINSTNPFTALTHAEARNSFSLEPSHKVFLFFGNVAEYKGLDLLIAALSRLAPSHPDYRLIIAGRIKCSPDHWHKIKEQIASLPEPSIVIQDIRFIPDDEVERYFKAADLLVLPYRQIFQSGVLFLGYNFGLPVLAADVGSLREEIVQGETGFVFEANSPVALAREIEDYLSSNLFHNLEHKRHAIRDYARDRYSWSKVTAITTDVYTRLLHCSREAEGNAVHS